VQPCAAATNKVMFVRSFIEEDNIFAQKLDDATTKGREEGIQIGEEKGEMKAKIAVAKAMLADNVDINTIAKFTGLSAKENIHS